MKCIDQRDIANQIRNSWEIFEKSLTDLHSNNIRPIKDQDEFDKYFTQCADKLKFLQCEDDKDQDILQFTQHSWIPLLNLIRKPSTFFDISKEKEYFLDKIKYIKLIPEMILDYHVTTDFQSFVTAITHFESLVLLSDNDSNIPSISYLATAVGTMGIVVKLITDKSDYFDKFFGNFNPFDGLIDKYTRVREIVTGFAMYQKVLYNSEDLNMYLAKYQVALVQMSKNDRRQVAYFIKKLDEELINQGITYIDEAGSPNPEWLTDYRKYKEEYDELYKRYADQYRRYSRATLDSCKKNYLEKKAETLERWNQKYAKSNSQPN